MKTVLIVDDDEACRAPVADLLRSCGWSVHEAENGKIGLEVARKIVPDAIICDLLMPITNGFQLCQGVREDRQLKDTKIIVLTGRDYPTDRKIAEEVGANDYLVKPLEIRHLMESLERLTGEEIDSHFSNEVPTRTVSFHGTQLRFWGVRGSTPTPGPHTLKYGGNTSCVEVRADDELIILDAGSGIRVLGHALADEFDDRPIDATLLLTHTHWDHIQGLPFFGPAYNPSNLIRIFGMEGAQKGLKETLDDQMRSPYFPISMGQMAANITVEELREMQFQIGRVRMEACYVNHPDVCVGYRLNTSSGSVCYIPDHESAPEGFSAGSQTVPSTIQKRVTKFVQNCDVLILDAQYTLEEYRTHVGWGHGCLDEVIRLAREARVKQLFLFHHDPSHDDDFMDKMLKHARDLAAGSDLFVDVAREGMKILLEAAV